MAKITIVDEHDEVIGAEDRKIAVEKGLIHRIARVIVKNSKGEIYLQKRGPKVPTWPGRWDQSVGGHVDEGENYEDAAKREMSEELGIIDVTVNFVVKWFKDEDGGNGLLKRFNVLYEVIYDGKVTLSEESSDGGWFSAGVIKKWMSLKPDDFTPGCRETINKYREEKLGKDAIILSKILSK